MRAGTDNARRRLVRLNATIEVSELEVSGLAPRKRELRDGEMKPLVAEREAETALSDRSPVLGDIDGIAAFAGELGEFLKYSELTERRAFISSFVEEMVVGPDQGTIRYTLPLLRDALTAGMGAKDMSIPKPVFQP